MEKEVQEVILHVNDRNIMDSYERTLMIDEMLHHARLINMYIVYLTNRLNSAKKQSFFWQVPKLNSWMHADKFIVEDIIRTYKWNF